MGRFVVVPYVELALAQNGCAFSKNEAGSALGVQEGCYLLLSVAGNGVRRLLEQRCMVEKRDSLSDIRANAGCSGCPIFGAGFSKAK